jgi:hypothetical protein
MSLYSAQVFFLFGFSEEKEFVMFAVHVCVRDIPET